MNSSRQAAAPDRPRRRQRAAAAALVAIIGVFYLATLRPGQLWGDDFAMYILQARNIASGNWSAPTGYLYNANYASLGPAAYPPLFPLLLAPLYRMWGMNLTPMKVEVLVFFLAALYLVFEFVSRQLPFAYAVSIVAVLGLSPYFWEFKENVVSDLPFLFFSMLALCVISACDRQAWQNTASASAAVACVYLCFATRTAGVVFLPCLLLSAMPRLGVVRRRALFAAAGAVLLMGVHSLILRGANSYGDQLRAPWGVLPHNLMAYSWGVRHSVLGVGSGAFAWAFLLVLAALGGAGLALRLRRGPSLSEAFTLSYALVVLQWRTEADVRLLIPVLPMWLLYISVALRSLPRRRECIAGGALLAVIAGGFAVRYSKADFGPIRQGLGDQAFMRAGAYIRSRTPRESVLIFAKPRLLALVAERNVSAYHEPSTDQELWKYFASISAGYVLVNREFPDDQRYLEPFLLRGPAQAREIYADGAFRIYALR